MSIALNTKENYRLVKYTATDLVTDKVISSGYDIEKVQKIAESSGKEYLINFISMAGYSVDSGAKPDGKCFGISGEPVNVWKNKFLIQLLDDKRTTVVKTSNVLSIDCVSSNTAVPILGTYDFLKDFKVTLNYPEKTFTLEW